MTTLALRCLLTTLCLGLASSSFAGAPADQGLDVPPSAPFKEGDVIDFENASKLRAYIPEPFWEHRQYFFHEGMQLKIGPFLKDFSASDLFKRVDQKMAGTARIGRDERGEGWLEFYVAGTPFPEIEPNDPDAGTKLAWNAVHKHSPMEGGAHFRLSSWEADGSPGTFLFQGTAWGMRLSNRIDKAEQGGQYFDDDERRSGGKFVLEHPSEWRSLAAVGYRYVTADNRPLADVARDVWAYIPGLRRTRRIPASTEEQETIPGTDFAIEDINGFNFRTGVVQKYEFKLIGEAQVITPIDTTRKAFPLEEHPNLGPYGYSFADDVWQVRDAWVVWIRRRSENPAYSKKLLWIDKQTYSSLYAAAWDRDGELWRLIYMVHRWSESPAHQEVIAACEDRGETRIHHKRESELAHPQTPGAERWLYPIGHIIVNVRNGTGSRIEAWNAHATHLRDVDKRRNLDSGRLATKGR